MIEVDRMDKEIIVNEFTGFFSKMIKLILPLFPNLRLFPHCGGGVISEAQDATIGYLTIYVTHRSQRPSHKFELTTARPRYDDIMYVLSNVSQRSVCACVCVCVRVS